MLDEERGAKAKIVRTAIADALMSPMVGHQDFNQTVKRARICHIFRRGLGSNRDNTRRRDNFPISALPRIVVPYI